jgi:hypothetical protein
MNFDALLAYLIDRAHEASTWRSVVRLLALAGWTISEDHAEMILLLGMVAAELVGVLLKDRLKRTDQPAMGHD